MDRIFILIDNILLLFYNKTNRFVQNCSIYLVPEHGAVKGISDSLATLDMYWERIQRTETWESRMDTTGKRLPEV